MKNYPNIEKSALRPGEYVGYGAGCVWRLVRISDGWRGIANNQAMPLITEETLEEISQTLTQLTQQYKRG